MPSFSLVTLKFISHPIFNPAVVNARDFLDALQFDDQLVLDESVSSVTTIEPNVLVLYWQCKLEWKCDIVVTQFVNQSVIVSRLEQSRSDVSVDFKGQPITRFESSSNSIFVLFVPFVVAFAPWTHSVALSG